MLSHALRRPTRHTSIFRLHPYQHFNHTLTPTEVEEATWADFRLKRSAYIQTWEPLHNLADAWALLRAVERRYGKVLEAQFVKDNEMTNKYQKFTYVCFLDRKSRDKIPSSGDVFDIAAPVMEDRPGGPGLNDIKHLLESSDVVDDFELELKFSPVPNERVISAQIFRTARDHFTYSHSSPVAPNRELARSFLYWRGFHKPEPPRGKRGISENDWFGRPPREQLVMSAAINRFALIADVQIPVFRKPKIDKKDGKVSDSSSASTSMDSSESSSPTTPDIPISHKSTSKSTQSHPLPTKSPTPPSQSPPGPTQLPPEPTPPKSTTTTRQLTPEQKKTVQKQMKRAKQLIAKTKNSTSKPRESKAKEKLKDQELDGSPEEPLEPASKGIIATFWKMIGRWR